MSVLVAALLLSAAVAVVAAEEPPPPPFDGLMSFHSIQGPDGPEEFSWAVKLADEEELRTIDDTHVGVYWTDTETLATTITAGRAHAADGATVPTTIAVTQPNIITLTVHHRGGNSAAGGAPFDYPISQGSGWEGGFQTYPVDMGPLTEQSTPPPAPTCTVPGLAGRTLRAARRQLRRSQCALGEVRGERSRGARVVRQFRQPGRELPAGTEVGVKLLVSQPGAPEREQSDRQERSGPVQADEDGEQAGEAGEGRAEQRGARRQGQHPCGEGGAEHPGGRAGEPAPVLEEGVGQGEAEGDREHRHRRQLQQRRPPESGCVHPRRGYSTTTLPFMKGWILQW